VILGKKIQMHSDSFIVKLKLQIIWNILSYRVMLKLTKVLEQLLL
jgi:hypothetical protein